MITHLQIIQDLESIYKQALMEGNLSLALKAKELQGKELEIVSKENRSKNDVKNLELDVLLSKINQKEELT
mgnify:CR=1 FL=1